MASTEQIEAMLAAYVDGELDASGIAEIEQHLVKHPEHRHMLNEMRDAKRMIGDLPRATAPADVSEALAAQLERGSLLGDVDIGVDSGTGFSRWPQFGAIAAVLVLTMGLSFVLYRVLPSLTPTAPNVAIVTPERPREPEPRATETDSVAANTPRDGRAVDRAAGGAAGDVAAADSADSRLRSMPEDSRSRGALADRDVGRSLDNVSGTPGGTDLLGATGGASALSAAGPIYLVVNASDARSASTDVVNYLAMNRLEWQPVSSNAVASSRGNNEPRNDQPTGFDRDRTRDVPAPPAPPTTTGVAETSPSTMPIDPTDVSRGDAAIARREAADPAPEPKEPTTSPADPAGGASPDLSLEATAAAADPTLQQQRRQAQQIAPPDAYVYAVKMTTLEAQQLSDTLSQPQKRQQAQVLRSPAEYAQQQMRQQSGMARPTMPQQPAQPQQQLQPGAAQASPSYQVPESKPDQPTPNAQQSAPDSVQQTGQQQSAAPAPVGQNSNPGATGAAPTTSPAVLEDESKKEVAEEKRTSDSEVLAPGDTVRVRAVNERMSGSPAIVDGEQTIDADGNVTLPGLGLVKAAGLTGKQVAAESIAPIYEKSKDQQNVAPIMYRWSVEKVLPQTPPPTVAEPSSQPVAPGTAEVPTTNPADGLVNPSRGIDPQAKVDVVIVVQRMDDGQPPAPPATNPTTQPAEPSQPSGPATQPTTR